MKLMWINIAEVLWLLAALYLGSQLTYWLGDDFFMHAFSIIMVASPVWLSRLLVAVDRRFVVLVVAILIYGFGAFMVAPTFSTWGIRNFVWVPYLCTAVFAGMLFMHVREKKVAA